MPPHVSKILYATDLSESARLALGYAVSLAGRYKASLTIIHVIPDYVDLMSEGAGFDIEGHFGVEAWREFNEKATVEARAKARKRVFEAAIECASSDPDCPVKRAAIKIETGDPAERILAEITRGGHDMVVMGAHGRSEFMDMLLGGVASKIVRRGLVPVLTVRLPETVTGLPS